MTHIARARRPTSCSTRSRISCAALVVKVMARICPGWAAPDRRRHYLEGSREDVAAYLLTLDAINFGSGWFPTVRKRPGCSGYYTVASALADKFRAGGPWSAEELRELDAPAVARVLEQE